MVLSSEHTAELHALSHFTAERFVPAVRPKNKLNQMNNYSFISSPLLVFLFFFATPSDLCRLRGKLCDDVLI